MTEEEKKAIKYLKNEIERVNKENNFKKMPKEIVCIPLFLTYSETLLNLIEKLQKENEKLKKGSDINVGSISKDKIREIVKKLQSYSDIAEQQINQSTIIADSDSLNYGRKEAHITDIRLLEELLEEE